MLHKGRTAGTRSGRAVLAQVAVVASFVVLYFGVRGSTAGDADQARRNAFRVCAGSNCLASTSSEPSRHHRAARRH